MSGSPVERLEEAEVLPVDPNGLAGSPQCDFSELRIRVDESGETVDDTVIRFDPLDEFPAVDELI